VLFKTSEESMYAKKGSVCRTSLTREDAELVNMVVNAPNSNIFEVPL